MKRHFTIIALAALTATATARNYEKPVKPAVDQPTAAELTSGNNYFIFNVGKKTYVTGGEQYSTSLITQTNPFLAVTVTRGEGENSGYYQLKLNGRFIFGGWNGNVTKENTYLFWDSSNNRGFVDYANGQTQVPYWKFTAVDGTQNQYYWQTSATEGAKYLVGHNSGERISSEDAATDDAAKWIFVAESAMSDYFYYEALNALYNTIETASGVGIIDVTAAKEVFCNDNASRDELNAAQKALQKVVDSTISKSTRTTLSWSNATCSGGNTKVENGGNNIGYTGKESTVTLDVINGTDGQNYLMEFKTGASGCSAILSVTLTNNSTNEVVLSEEVNVQSHNNWDLVDNHSFFISHMSAGTYTLKIATKEVTSGSFAGNWGRPTFTKVTPMPGKLDLNSGVYDPTGAWTIHVENNTNVGFIKNGHTAKYYIMNNNPGYYDLAISVSKQGQGGTYTVSIDDLEGNNEYKREAIEVGTDGAYTIHTIAVGKLTAGAKVLTLTFNATHDNWICNYKDVEFKAQAIQVAVSEAGYATLYDADKALTIPEGVQAYIVANEANSIQLTEVTGTIPTGVPVVVKAAEGTYNFAVADNVEADYSSNLLHGSATSDNVTAVDGTNYYYMLANGSKGIGFYWGAQDGSNQFSVGVGKAYLVLPQAQNVKAFIFGAGTEDIATDISRTNVESNRTGKMYDLSGRRITNTQTLRKGIYVNGSRKVTVK